MIQQRNIALCIVYSFITCGIYEIYWFVKLTDEANSVSFDNRTASGGMAFLWAFITCGVYGLFWMYKQGAKIDEAKAARGIQPGNAAVIYLILAIFGLGIVSLALMQDELNKLA